jgi:hypothetical protein
VERPIEVREAVAERIRRQHQSADRHAVELLELAQRVGFTSCFSVITVLSGTNVPFSVRT